MKIISCVSANRILLSLSFLQNGMKMSHSTELSDSISQAFSLNLGIHVLKERIFLFPRDWNELN